MMNHFSPRDFKEDDISGKEQNINKLKYLND